MGKLRTVPKYKSFLTESEFEEYSQVLQEAQSAAESSHIFWDLDPDEKASKVKKIFIYVARKLGMNVTVRQVRGSNSLALQFKKSKPVTQGRMSADDSRKRILSVLRAAGKPMKKNQIIKDSGVSASTWNLRVRELIGDGLIVRHGERRDTTYEAT